MCVHETTSLYVLVGVAGVEPARPCGHWLLEPACLPFHHTPMVWEEGFEPPTTRSQTARSTAELSRNANGGHCRIRTGVGGVAIRSLASRASDLVKSDSVGKAEALCNATSAASLVLLAPLVLAVPVTLGLVAAVLRNAPGLPCAAADVRSADSDSHLVNPPSRATHRSGSLALTTQGGPTDVCSRNNLLVCVGRRGRSRTCTTVWPLASRTSVSTFPPHADGLGRGIRTPDNPVPNRVLYR